LKSLLSDWRDLLPLAGLVVLAAVGMILWLKKKPEDDSEIERQRRSYLNRVGRIVEGQVLEIVDRKGAAPPSNGRSTSSGLFVKHHAGASSSGAQKLLYYTYSISGVTYETAQDVTGLEERLHLTRVATGQIASVKYDPSNPSNSILLADDWSGLH
jgi:Protein of unknown function (DUF3592)